MMKISDAAAAPSQNLEYYPTQTARNHQPIAASISMWILSKT